ncbi:hypothetical protein [Robiginitalea aurantiaca]|uniref:Uncharacterized protein n=1 Tax=Robiginitalea aurantiaca TaxID=3056915 RepID=A0ABT7WDE5_9FLAO|nr:hypothetical protein [Robiginitalea aurantiaca]MDM9630926.1 hypothetical protein [Robiginitalea aurantiaca]
MSEKIFVGKNEYHPNEGEVQGSQIELEGEVFYKIANSDLMRPFFMSIVSDSNHWMFISSNGGLTAGRKNSEFALFPYYTDDKITESAEITGSKTLLRLEKDGKTFLWEPFSERQTGAYSIRRNLYKNAYCNKVIFEEVNSDLGLTLRYQWNSTNLFGFAKKASLMNHGNTSVNVHLLDGLQNILPYGVTTDLQNSRSNLVDAYKKSELQPEAGLGIYSLSAIIVDKAEPSESLKANVAWSVGLKDPYYLISSMQLDAFRSGLKMTSETDIRGEKGAYFIGAELSLPPKQEHHWMLVANVNQGPSDIEGLLEDLTDPEALQLRVLEDIRQGTRRLIGLTAAADGLQLTRDQLRITRHYANTMYNIMRGGIFDQNYEIEKRDFTTYLRHANSGVYKEQEDRLQALPDTFTLFDLRELTKTADPDFFRLACEYLPLKFSRRHGDPSRPWNRFSINTQSEKDGSKILDYEGNWRDIFQNWEALAHAYPEFIDGMIHKFLNASTFDGYNPYRITKSGIDWEVIEPDDPWSYIGYWGDHQLIYLLKFLEFIEAYYPGRLLSYWDRDLFVYANVPYRIKPYKDILNNPKDTIDFNHELEQEISRRKEQMGADGTLIQFQDAPYRVNLVEKLLATLLAKASNFIPEAGIWLNTQRPEWNDANNALVGNGVSMVTLYYLKRFLSYLEGVLETYQLENVTISEELERFFKEVTQGLQKYEGALNGPISDTVRKDIVDALGKAACRYRTQVYDHGFSGVKNKISTADLKDFTRVMSSFADHAIRANQRPDKLYHSYNLMTVSGEDSISVAHLSEMLEGQVAVLSSGALNPEQALEVLDALRKSALYRKDQNSYILYPDKDLPRFVDKNKIPDDQVGKSSLLLKLLSDGNRQVIEKDVAGNYHFNGSFNNAKSLDKALSDLPEQYHSQVSEQRELILEIFEAVFDHKSFTGRSGTFFGYEGLGSIYWHMVSKLALAAQECCIKALNSKVDSQTCKGLLEHYRQINEGIGVHKPPQLYGAFPTDPYSHTPAHRGAQQPGMTGQVKEDILVRMAELGVQVAEGCIHFGSGLLQPEEFLTKPRTFDYVDVRNRVQTIEVPEKALAFTYCQVPVVYCFSEEPYLEIHLSDGTVETQKTAHLGASQSDAIFRRTGKIQRLNVGIKV